jgi:sugar lactone lactonase YvrE
MRTLHAFDQPLAARFDGALLRAAGAAALALALAACGGSADAPPPPDESTPAQVAPVITQQPVDASVVQPATATFTAAATGTPTPAAQWQASTDGGETWTAISGATSASFTTPATTLGDSGTMYRAVFSNTAGSATSNGAMLTVTAAPGVGLSLLAGDIGGAGGIDGTGVTARFNKIDGLVVDPSGNVFVADTANHAIRKITPAGVVTTVAGQPGVRGSADGTGAAARFSDPMSITLDASGNLFVADFSNSTIRKITPAGVVTTFAGVAGVGGTAIDGPGASARFEGPLGIAIDASGNLYVADEFNESIRKITPAGVVSTFAGQTEVPGDNDGTGTGARFNAPNSVAVDSAGNFYVGEGSHVVRRISPAGVVVTLAGSASAAGGSTDGTGGAARFNYPRGLAVDAVGNVYVADANDCLIREISPTGVVSTLAGALGAFSSIDGTGTAATFNLPSGIAVDAAGTVYVGEENGFVVRKVTPAGVVSTLAGDPVHVGLVDDVGTAARFNLGLSGTAVDASGNVFVSDTGNSVIREVTPGGSVSTFVDDVVSPQGLAIDAAGNLYLGSEQTVLKVTPGKTVFPFAGSPGNQGSADGTGSAASFGDVSALAVDTAGNVYVADSINDTIRKITPAAVVTTLAGTAGTAGSTDGSAATATFSSPYGVAVDAAGNVYVADAQNGTIRKITAAGTVSTLAGTAGVTGSADGTGAAASFDFPFSIVVDSVGNLYVAELSNNDIRKITPAGVVSTIVGVAGQVGVRLGPDARLARPSGLSLIGDQQLILTSANAVLLYQLP